MGVSAPKTLNPSHDSATVGDRHGFRASASDPMPTARISRMITPLNRAARFVAVAPVAAVNSIFQHPVSKLIRE